MRMFERHYRKLGQIVPYLKTSTLREITFVDITPAATWFYEESDQEDWDLERDFPTVLSPWPMAWYEFKWPRFSHSATVHVDYPSWCHGMGFLVYRSPELSRKQSQALLRTGAFHEVIRRGLKKGAVFSSVIKLKEKEARDRLAATLPRRLSTGTYVRWLCLIHGFFDLAGRLYYLGMATGCLSDEGGWLHDLHMMGVAPALLRNITDESGIPEGVEWIGLLAPLFYSIALLHCKNVTLEEIRQPPLKVQKARAKKGRPEIRYKTLVVSPMRRRLLDDVEGDGENRGNAIKRALHICRGHFKDYRESGLFGKFHDIYWWEMHVRGSREMGEIRKTYEVKP